MRSAPARRLLPYAAAAAGGALYCLGYVGWGLWPLLLVFLGPLWWALERLRERGPLAAALAGASFGGAAYAGGYLWLWRLVEVFLEGELLFGAALWLVHGAWFAAGFALYALVFRAIRRRGGALPLAGVPPLLLLEWLQPQLFPVHAGAGLLRGPVWLVQAAELGGPLLLSALVAAANAALYVAATRLRGGRSPLLPAAAAAGLALAVSGYGLARTQAFAPGGAAEPGLRVGLVQVNLGLMEKRRQGVVSHRRHLEASRVLLEAGALDLLVWPETAYVRGLRRPLPLDGEPIRAELDVPLLFGATSVWHEEGRRVVANSALLVDGEGEIRDAYDKNLLIPLSEYAPFAEIVPALEGLLPHVQDFRASESTPPLRLEGLRIATPICYEAVRPGFVRRMVREARPHLLVTLANDAWFGDSQEPWIHLHLARLRAVEHRRWLVRSTNSGVSAVVDPAGRLRARTGLGTKETLRATVHPRQDATLYARLGDWPGWLAAGLALAGLARPRRAR